MKQYLKLIWVLMKYALPIFLLLLPAIAIFGLLSGWDRDNELLSNEYAQYTSVFVGYSYQSSTSQGVKRTRTQRSYWLIPKTLSSPKILSITYDGSGNVTHKTTKAGFWFSVASYLFIAVACYFVWARGYDPFNKSNQQGPAADAHTDREK